MKVEDTAAVSIGAGRGIGRRRPVVAVRADGAQGSRLAVAVARSPKI